MKSLFITLFAIVLACNAPSSLAYPNVGWASAGLAGPGIGGGWGNVGGDDGGWGMGGGSGGAKAGGIGAGGAGAGIPAGWAGTGSVAGPQIISATWGASLPGPSVNLVPATHSQLVKLLPGPGLHGHGHGC